MKYKITPTEKRVLKETLAHYRAWNDEKFLSQVMESNRMTATERWQAYQDLFELAIKIHPQSSRAEQLYEMHEWSDYLNRIRRFEKRRQALAKST